MKNLNIKVFTAFSGYDSQCMALDRLAENFPGFSYELVGWSEIDKYAIQAHNAVYPQWSDRNFGDISKIDWAKVPDFDLFTMSSPCQDFSSAGLQKGGVEGSGTRSSLLWECRKAILAKKPKYILFENVKNLVSKKFLPYLQMWQRELQSYGYQNFAKVLNAKDYGVPQNRERIFMISILDRDASYYFPEPFKLEKRLKDVLEKNVDEKYSLTSVQKDNLVAEPLRIQKATKQGYIEVPPGSLFEGVEFKGKKIKEGDGLYLGTSDRFFRGGLDGVSRALKACSNDAGCVQNYRIRKLTPRECFRLMGVRETDIDKIQAAGISNSRQYRLAGNSIVVDTLYHLMRKLFIDTGIEWNQLFF